MAEEEVHYASVKFKIKKESRPEAQEEKTVYDGVKLSEKKKTNEKKGEETLYDEVKVGNNTPEQTPGATAGLVPEKETDGRYQYYPMLAWCFGILSVLLLFGLIGVLVYFSLIPQSDGDELNILKANQSALQTENRKLLNANNKLSSDFTILKKDHNDLVMQFDNLNTTLTVSDSKITNLTGENQKLTMQSQKLGAEIQNLTDHITNIKTTWNKNNISRAQWSVDAYCPKDKVSGRKCSACRVGWLSSQSSCYAINNPSGDGRKTWEEAQEDCRIKNSNLVVVADETEKKFISDSSWGSSGTNGYWIGLRAETNKWKWINGSNLTNNAWIQDLAQDGQCAISVNNEGWKSVMCNDKQQWICEMMALTI